MTVKRPAIRVTQWPKWADPETQYRKDANFRNRQGDITLDRNVRDLEYELGAMGVESAEVAVGLDGRQSRRDGWPLQNASGHPGVVLTYTHPTHGVMRVATDRFFHWVDNLRAIVLTLEALRMMERYGTTGNGRQYEGFRQLPASTGATMDVNRAAAVIKEHSKVKYEPERLLEVRELAEIAVRAALFNTHPDRNPGKADASDVYHTVEQARQALSAHHGGGL